MKYAIVALFLAGCLDGHPDTFAVADETNVVLVDGAFVSAPFPTHTADGTDVPATVAWIPFHAREHLTVQFRELPSPPTVVGVWIAFDATGIGSGLASGDLARYEAFDAVAYMPPQIMSAPPAVTPASSVTFYNATEQDYFIRVVVD